MGEAGEIGHARVALPGRHGPEDVGEVVGRAGGAYTAKDGDGALAVGEGLVEIASRFLR